jgi:predicted dehydrogenase
MKNIRIGLIGAGWLATFSHVPAVQSSPLAELVAVQNLEHARAEKIVCDFGAKHACTTVEAIHVANQWPNRMIGDEQQPADCELG